MKTKLHKKIMSGLLVLITVITAFIGFGSAVFASEPLLNDQTGYSYTGVSLIYHIDFTLRGRCKIKLSV